MKYWTRSLVGVIFYFVASLAFAQNYSVNLPQWLIDSAQGEISTDISALTPGEKHEVDYLGSPIWIYRRTQQELAYIENNYKAAGSKTLDAIAGQIKQGANSTTGLVRARKQLHNQPALEKSRYRSIDDEYFVFESIGRYGCQVQMGLPAHAEKPDDAIFYDPCNGDTYDLAGRFIDSGALEFSAKTGKRLKTKPGFVRRLRIPPHRYMPNGDLHIGVSNINDLPEIKLSEETLYSDRTPTEILLQAAAFNDIDKAQNAIQAGADINPPGVAGETTGSLALLRAVLYSSVEMVELLISQGAEPGQDEMFWAEQLQRHDVVNLLKNTNQK